MLSRIRSVCSTRLRCSLLGILAGLAAIDGFATGAPTEWCGTSAIGNVVYFDYCGADALWHFDRFDLATDQWLAPIPVGSHSGFAVGAPGLLVATYDGVTRYELDGSNPSSLPNTLSGASSLAMDGRFLFLGNYSDIQSYDLILQHQVNVSNYAFGYDNPHPFVADPTHGQLLGLAGNSAPAQLSYDANGVLQAAPGYTFYDLPFTAGYRNYVAPDAATFVNSGGAVFSTGNLDEVAWVGAAFDDLAFAGPDIVVLRYDTLVRIDRASYFELGTFTLDHTYSDLALDGTDVVAFYSEFGTPHSRRIPIASIVPQGLPPAVSPDAHPFVASKVQLDLSGILYLLVGSDGVIHRYNLSTNAFVPSIALPGKANTFAVDQVTGRAFVGLASPAVVTVAPAATAAQPFFYSRQPMDEMTIISGRLYTSLSDDNWEEHQVRDEGTGTVLSIIDTRNPTAELVWSPTNRHVYYTSINQLPENVYWDSVDSGGIITGSGESNYFGDPLNAIPPVRPDPTGAFLVLGSGQTMDASTMLLRPQSLPDMPTDVAWIGTTMYAAVSGVPGRTMLRRYDANLGVAATAYALGAPQRLMTYGNALVLVGQWSGGTLITRIPADFSGSDFSVAGIASNQLPVPSGQQASAVAEFRNQGPAGPTSVHLTISPDVSVGTIAWNCETSAASAPCGAGASFDSTQSLAAGDWLRVTGTFVVSPDMAGKVVFTATANAGVADPVSGNNQAVIVVPFDKLFDGTFD